MKGETRVQEGEEDSEKRCFLSLHVPNAWLAAVPANLAQEMFREAMGTWVQAPTLPQLQPRTRVLSIHTCWPGDTHELHRSWPGETHQLPNPV